MDMEARSLPVEQSKPLLAKVKEYKADLGALKEQAKQATRSTAVMGDAARAELVSVLVKCLFMCVHVYVSLHVYSVFSIHVSVVCVKCLRGKMPVLKAADVDSDS